MDLGWAAPSCTPVYYNISSHVGDLEDMAQQHQDWRLANLLFNHVGGHPPVVEVARCCACRMQLWVDTEHETTQYITHLQSMRVAFHRDRELCVGSVSLYVSTYNIDAVSYTHLTLPTIYSV